MLKNKEEAVSLEQQNRQVKSEDTAERLIKEYEVRLQNEPKNLKLLRDLGELYTSKKQFDKALEYYARIKSSDVGGGDAALERNIAETTIRKFDHQISQLDPNAVDYAEKSAAMQAEKRAYQLAECQKRVEHYPTDLQIRFEYGQFLFQAGKIGEAIQEFQKAKNNPNRRVQAMSFLGQCFGKRGMNDLAARTLQDAIKEKPVFDDEKKELTYVLGTVLEKMGKAEEAIEQFKLIYEIDIGYKDVAARVDKYYEGKG
jgi:tetratricopeptide (TPR) repeat protein